MARSYRDLKVYQQGHRLGVRVHQFSLKLPKHEMYETGSQLRRSSKSVSANIVEGYGRRRYRAEYVRFLTFSHASCDESVEWLEYVRELYPELAEAAATLISEYLEVGRQLYRFIEWVEQNEHG